jgi:glycosyltransferase involved in cell wall biosynthesis
VNQGAGDADVPGGINILTYCPRPYNGKGPPQSCVSIQQYLAEDGASARLVVPRSTKAMDPSIDVVQALPLPLRYLPWSRVAGQGRVAIDRVFCRLLDKAPPARTVAYFWPDVSTHVVEHARARGILTVREMINSYRGMAKAILDAADAAAALPVSHRITAESVAQEQAELQLYDGVFAPNACVEQSLLQAGVDPARILPTAFGWSPARYNFTTRQKDPSDLRVLFVGTLCVRKGVHHLLEAWKRSRIEGTLVLAGSVDDAFRPMLDQYSNDPSVSVLSYVDDMSDLYSSADVFVFPSLEEGGPQVTYEAAGAGLPLIATPMGRGRIVENGVNGFVVQPGDIDGLMSALITLAQSPDLRAEMGRRAKSDAARFSYSVVGRERGTILRGLVSSRLKAGCAGA